MKKLYWVSALLAISACGAMAESSESVDPVPQFEKQVAAVESFFEKPQMMLLTNSGGGAGDSIGKYSYLAKYSGSGVKYDVRKTDSLVSPFTGQISVTVQWSTNSACGSIPFLRTHIGWRTEAEAAASADNDRCFLPRPPYVATFNYAFQKGKWVFKSVTGRYLDEQVDKRQPLLTATLGAPADSFLPVTTEEGKAFNASWQRAFLP